MVIALTTVRKYAAEAGKRCAILVHYSNTCQPVHFLKILFILFILIPREQNLYIFVLPLKKYCFPSLSIICQKFIVSLNTFTSHEWLGILIVYTNFQYKKHLWPILLH